MKIVFLSTGRGLREGAIDDLRARLDLHDSDVVGLISWHRPRAILPIDAHLVLGPHIRLAGNLATVHRVQPRADWIAASAPLYESSLEAEAESESTVESASSLESGAEAASTTEAGTAAAGKAQLPVFHPRRLRKAVGWRVRRLKRAVRTSSRLNRVRTHPQYRRVRGRLSPGASLAFAAGCLRADKVHTMTRDADLVVALDAASHRGAWALAQRVQGPDVVIGLPAAKRLLELRRVSDQR